jgi:hypothetical protein
MRFTGLFLSIGVLAACSTAPQPTTRSPQAQREYERLIGDKVAGAPLSCLPNYNADDMLVIDERTIAYRRSAGQVFVNHMRNACMGLGGTTTLVTRSFGSPQTCSGDIAQVTDLTNRMIVGSCVFGDFIPYTKPRSR